jgi:hypothetical protein
MHLRRLPFTDTKQNDFWRKKQAIFVTATFWEIGAENETFCSLRVSLGIFCVFG